MNHPNDLIRLDFANPLVWKHLHFYPEVTTTVSESWQAAKWVNEIKADELTPMWANWAGASHRHFYIKELAQCLDEKRSPGDHFNVLLCLRGLDPHRDSPCEILHTIFLGEDKYVWHDTSKAWNDDQGTLFAARLQSAFVDGLSLAPLQSRYMVQYKKSLIGKHYKALQQLAIFQLDNTLCSPALFELWKMNGVLGALLWYPEIKDMDNYIADLTVSIDNVLDCWAIVDPTRITQKYKLHVLPHIPTAVRWFGPSILFQTEVFECWNAIFRLCSVLSNHQAPSLDIATTLADMERFKHQVSGGWWKLDGGDWTQAGYKINGFFAANKQLQRRLGWAPGSQFKPGTLGYQYLYRTSPTNINIQGQ
ncbi:hypothetical protein C8R45DRAFT_1101972 [Mycena sanguinolenta]|nr:hypothetical protein C8R45DRAFT_1101972 [Mycena sanguinolenta]